MTGNEHRDHIKDTIQESADVHHVSAVRRLGRPIRLKVDADEPCLRIAPSKQGPLRERLSPRTAKPTELRCVDPRFMVGDVRLLSKGVGASTRTQVFTLPKGSG